MLYHLKSNGRAHDERRNRFLHNQGIQVLRFWNNDVLQQPEAVLEAIFLAATTHQPSPLAPLPEGEGDLSPNLTLAQGEENLSLNRPLPLGEGRGEGIRIESQETNQHLIYQDIPGYCRNVILAEIAKHGHVLTPGRYVGAQDAEAHRKTGRANGERRGTGSTNTPEAGRLGV